MAEVRFASEYERFVLPLALALASERGNEPRFYSRQGRHNVPVRGSSRYRGVFKFSLRPPRGIDPLRGGSHRLSPRRFVRTRETEDRTERKERDTRGRDRWNEVGTGATRA